MRPNARTCFLISSSWVWTLTQARGSKWWTGVGSGGHRGSGGGGGPPGETWRPQDKSSPSRGWATLFNAVLARGDGETRHRPDGGGRQQPTHDKIIPSQLPFTFHWNQSQSAGIWVGLNGVTIHSRLLYRIILWARISFSLNMIMQAHL